MKSMGRMELETSPGLRPREEKEKEKEVAIRGSRLVSKDVPYRKRRGRY